jgi:hypothetical protein
MLIDFENRNRARGPDPDEDAYVQWDDRYAVTNITPHVFVERRTEPGWHFRTKEGGYVHDRNGQSGHLYTHPYPLSDREFLVSYKVDPADHYKNVADAYALYLVDTEGNHRLIHRDNELSCWHPTPLVARKVPPEIPSVRNAQSAHREKALCIVTDVYQGMQGIEPGEVKWLRINEAVPRYWATGRRWSSAQSSSGWKAALWPRVQWGVVPVEEDGSAYFEVPASRNIFFQALDKDFREIQRERTYVNYQAGEVRRCTGCHGGFGRVVPPVDPETTISLRRAPSVPQPQPCDLVDNGGDGQAGQVIHYPADVQPILDAKCVSCHGNTEPDGNLKLTGDVTVHYNTSYEELARKQLAGPIIPEFTSFTQGDRGNYNGAYLPPKNLGCYQSTLIDVLTDPAHPKNAKEDHTRMLGENPLMVLSRWVDSNYQFYGGYYGRRHGHWVNPDPRQSAYQPADFRRKPTFEEAISPRAPTWHR